MAEKSFNFKEALEEIKQPESIEKRIEYFLRSIIDFLRNHNIDIEDIDEIQFYICKENDTPLLYGLHASYTCKEEVKANKTYHQIHCLKDLKYPEASILLQLIECELTKVGYHYKRNFYNMGEEYDKYRMRDCTSIKL